MKFIYLAFPLAILLMAGCTSEDTPSTIEKAEEPATQTEEVVETTETSTDDANTETTAEEPAEAEETVTNSDNNQFSGYKLINVDGGDLSGYREANVVVDIGYGNREYWAFTNEHGQLVRVVAEELILQDDDTEDVTSDGRYYHDEAKVPGVEHSNLDEGHVIADSLGGVSNAYNITPQDSTLNRYGDQAYMEDVIRKAGGATDFEAIITYPDTKTHIPSHYEYSYTVRGNVVTDSFDNVNPDEVNEALGLTESEPEPVAVPEATGDVSSVDTNGNGQVTIQEAKDAGFTMPIMSDHWLYPYMRDNDNDGMVGE
ncbi:DNA/RNA non-specific endonuclease [Exiguobacterium sp. s28]|uniref:DNA/RNA non-specific endonuclease n=1 Tax=Exiguobacterium sp. s28 TaxID=2751238 RepID=UPI001BEA36AF|nr:DNA/RNA non-specific endonuclease [Exiguobacterium sp. s28]